VNVAAAFYQSAEQLVNISAELDWLVDPSANELQAELNLLADVSAACELKLLTDELSWLVDVSTACGLKLLTDELNWLVDMPTACGLKLLTEELNWLADVSTACRLKLAKSVTAAVEAKELKPSELVYLSNATSSGVKELKNAASREPKLLIG